MTLRYEAVFRLKKLTDANIILIAARHNKREALNGKVPDNIDVSRSRLNVCLRGPDSAKEVDELAGRLLAESKTPKPKITAVKGIELLFSLPNGVPFDVESFFEDCVVWAEGRFGRANILSADIHLDESNPHCHVLLMPLIEGRMRGSDMVGGRDELAAHHQSFYADVGSVYGIERPRALLKGAQKQVAVWEVLRRLQDRPAETLAQCQRAIQAAVMSKPDDWVADLGIDVGGASLELLALSPGSGPQTHAGALDADRRLLLRSLSCEGSGQEDGRFDGRSPVMENPA